MDPYDTSVSVLDLLLECSHTIDRLRDCDYMTKEDVCDSMESRISRIMGKVVAYPTCTSFKVIEVSSDENARL
jgi:hypothetical protein